MKLRILGAAGTVTGSKYLIESARSRVLVDCGLFQGKKELRLRNWAEPEFSPTALSAIVLTHAHIDHTGYLPLVVRRGFRGPIYCTEPTAELLGLLLTDSAHLQEEEADYLNRHGGSKHAPALPLYSVDDAAKTLTLLRPLPLNTPTVCAPGVEVTPNLAGHILGAASLTVVCDGHHLTFSGDVGRSHSPLLDMPAAIDLGEVLIVESTYGDRDHPTNSLLDEFAHVVQEALQKSGPIIIPAFAIGRTQEVLALLFELEKAKRIPPIPIFVDSPMAQEATELYMRYLVKDEPLGLLSGAARILKQNQRMYFTKAVEDSKRLNTLRGSFILISASGMVTGGRILHHMRNWLPRPEATVLFVGYQADGTRGATIQSKVEAVKIFGGYVPINAEIKTISALSGHADRGELIDWLKRCSGTPKLVRVTHGEPPAAKAFSHLLTETFSWPAQPAVHGELIELDRAYSSPEKNQKPLDFSST